jgi:outer membrane protein assembly factor BamD
MKKQQVLMIVLAVSLAGSLCPGAYAQKKAKVIKAKPTPAAKKNDGIDSAEPDKVLYDRASTDIKHKKYTEARLELQTLINTYPDSEYLAKAKLALADSYYKEGGTSNLTQAVEEYKNFIVFFPFLDEASYAQMQVGMAHYRMTEKSDRDNSHASAAEDEFRAFLLKYPQSPLVPQAEQYLRNVQEILADGEFRIARFYYVKADYRASAARLVEVSGRYPLYSQSDEALAMLGNIYSRAKQVSKNEDDKNHWADLAAQCYDRILRDYPLSSLAPEARERLKAMGMPVPSADPAALARMQKQQMFEKQHHQMALVKLPMGMIKSNPDVELAAQTGQPNLNPPDDLVSATDVLSQGAAGPAFSVAVGGVSTGGGASSGAGVAPAVDTESVGTSDSAPPTATGGSSVTTPDSSSGAPANPPAANAPADSSAIVSTPSYAPVADPAATPASQPATAANATDSSSAKPAASPNDPKTESTSKKKKGLHKLIPF